MVNSKNLTRKIRKLLATSCKLQVLATRPNAQFLNSTKLFKSVFKISLKELPVSRHVFAIFQHFQVVVGNNNE